jgi:hypothetical protein
MVYTDFFRLEGQGVEKCPLAVDHAVPGRGERKKEQDECQEFHEIVPSMEIDPFNMYSYKATLLPLLLSH